MVVLHSAQLVPLQAPKHRPIISPTLVSNRRQSGEASITMDYKTVFMNLCLDTSTEPVVDKVILQNFI